MLKTLNREIIIPDEYAGFRLDQALAQLISEFSRGRIQAWIKSGNIYIDKRIPRPKDKLKGGETVVIRVEFEEISTEIKPEKIDISILFEDEHILLIDKKAGMVVHPASGHTSGTLQNALLYYQPELVNIPRSGIVHRLDKLTSGIMVVAKTLEAHKSLVEQLQNRTVSRTYIALVHGVMVSGGTVDAVMGRHPVDRKRMAVVEKGKQAITHYRVEDRYRKHSLLKVNLETGRTHQIRVHMAYIAYPLLGDPVYGGRFKVPPNASDALMSVLKNFTRQALHAQSLKLIHPDSGQALTWSAPWPEDIKNLIEALQLDSQQSVKM